VAEYTRMWEAVMLSSSMLSGHSARRGVLSVMGIFRQLLLMRKKEAVSMTLQGLQHFSASAGHLNPCRIDLLRGRDCLLDGLTDTRFRALQF